MRRLWLQASVSDHFPDIHIMRSIPIGQRGAADRTPCLALADQAGAAERLFLTDTMIGGQSGATMAISRWTVLWGSPD
jgi:hypothetical protein